MDRHVAMSLLKTVVLLDVMEVITSDDNGPLHLHLLNDTGEDATTDGNVTSEWAFLVDVGSFDRLAGGLESETDITVVPQILLHLGSFSVKENRGLLLERFLILHNPNHMQRRTKLVIYRDTQALPC